MNPSLCTICNNPFSPGDDITTSYNQGTVIEKVHTICIPKTKKQPTQYMFNVVRDNDNNSIAVLAAMQGQLVDGWKIVRCDTTAGCFIYLMSK